MATDPIRVCIGTEPRTEIPRKVLAFSLEQHASAPLEFHTLTGGDWTGRGPLRQHTGFSLLRWSLPERFGFAGKAIYLDADQLCLGDVAELWNADRNADERDCVWCTWHEHRPRRRWFPFARARRRLPETSVMLVDCERARDRLWTLERIRVELERAPTRASYDAVMHLGYLDPPPRELDPWWNVMDLGDRPVERLADPRARLLHYTRVSRQPWYDPDHPARAPWERALGDALEAGAVTHEELAAACARFSLDAGRPDGMHPWWRARFVG